MPSYLIVTAVVLATALFAVLIRGMTRRFDGVLLILSGAASMFLAMFASSAVQTQVTDGTMALAMSEMSFNVGVLSPVFIVATLSVMRGIFKCLGE